MKRTLTLLLCLLLALSVSACGTQGEDPASRISELEAQITSLDEEAKAQKAELETLRLQNSKLTESASQLEKDLEFAEKTAALIRTNGLFRYKVGSPEQRLWLSGGDTAFYREYGAERPYLEAGLIGEGTVLEAHAAVTFLGLEGDEGEIWLLVTYPVYSIPAMPTFWVKAATCTLFSSKNRLDVSSPVYLREGARLETEDGGLSGFIGENEGASFTIINRIEDGYAYVSQAGGWGGRVLLEDVIYPDPATFTYG